MEPVNKNKIDKIQHEIEKIEKYNRIDLQIKTLFEMSKLRWRFPIFVSCFSENEDQLSQWRGYSNSPIALCLGFYRADLENICQDKDMKLVRCIYDKIEKSSIWEEWLYKTIDSYIEHENGENSYDEIDELFTIAAKIKDESFSEEDEWRIISKHSDDGLAIDFRPGKSMLIPYKKIPLGGDFKFAKIIIGPTPNPELSKRSLRWYLKTKNVQCDKVENTSIPFRSW